MMSEGSSIESATVLDHNNIGTFTLIASSGETQYLHY